MRPRNLLLVITHDTGRCLAPYGAPVETPHLSRLAQEGVLFSQAYCTSPQCSPSRASLLTGRVPSRHGLIGLTHRGFRLRSDIPTLPRILAAEGYATHLFGFQHEAADPHELGYQHIHRAESNSCLAVAPLVASFLKSAPAEPFLAVVGFQETHRPFPAAAGPVDGTMIPPYLPAAEEIAHDVARLHESIRRVDGEVGRIMEALAVGGLEESTLLVYTTDHGIAFPGAKATLFDPGIETALIARGPEPFAGGRTVPALVSNVDVLPTLLEWAGVQVPREIDGRSLLPVVAGDKRSVRDAVWLEMTYHAAYDPVRGIRTERFKYIRSHGELPLWVDANVDAGPSKEWFLRNRPEMFNRPRPAEYLFDLAADPWERRNVTEDPAYAEALAAMRERVEASMREYGDPLLEGPVPPPPGARLEA